MNDYLRDADEKVVGPKQTEQVIRSSFAQCFVQLIKFALGVIFARRCEINSDKYPVCVEGTEHEEEDDREQEQTPHACHAACSLLDDIDSSNNLATKDNGQNE